MTQPLQLPEGLTTKPAVTDEGVEFDTVVCEECGGDQFYIGLFNDRDPHTQVQCVVCYPSKPRTH